MKATLAVCFIALAATTAGAQDTDVPLTPTGGVYPVSFMPPDDTDLFQVCCLRADLTPVVELGCVDAVPSVVGTVSVTIDSTPNDDAEIRCYATDTTGLVSDYSPNAGIVDFTPPGSPLIVQ